MAQFLTIVLRLPDDKPQREQVCASYNVGQDLAGCRITALSLNDEVNVTESIIDHVSAFDAGVRRAIAAGNGNPQLFAHHLAVPLADWTNAGLLRYESGYAAVDLLNRLTPDPAGARRK